jgi:hypothetical protein
MLRSQALREIRKKYDARGKHPNTLKNLNQNPKWKNKKTIPIRIPEVFKDRLLNLVRDWDNETEEAVNTSEMNTEQRIESVKEKLRELLSLPVRATKSSDTLKTEIQELLESLE